MIILMMRNYNTIHVGGNVYYNVSEITWRCYCRFFGFKQLEGVVSTCFQGGWGMRIDG